MPRSHWATDAPWIFPDSPGLEIYFHQRSGVIRGNPGVKRKNMSLWLIPHLHYGCTTVLTPDWLAHPGTSRFITDTLRFHHGSTRKSHGSTPGWPRTAPVAPRLHHGWSRFTPDAPWLVPVHHGYATVLPRLVPVHPGYAMDARVRSGIVLIRE